MTSLPAANTATPSDAFDYVEETLAPRRTNQDAMVVIKTHEILINKETPGYKLYSRVTRIMFLVSFLCVLAVIFGTIWFCYELVNSAHALQQLQQTTGSLRVTR